MKEILTLSTERRRVILRQLSNHEDDLAYFEAVEENRNHLSQHGDARSKKYPSIKAVEERRETAGNDIRMGIWEDNIFKGSITAEPKVNDELELNYWLRASATGNGYATLAVRTMVGYLNPRFQRIFAEVHIKNQESADVLMRSNFQVVKKVEREWGKARVFELVK